MRCLVREEGSVEVGVSIEIEDKTDSHVCNLPTCSGVVQEGHDCISYMLYNIAHLVG